MSTRSAGAGQNCSRPTRPWTLCAAQPSPAVSEALQAAELRLADYVRPVELATEHLLLGLAVGQNEVADWFAERGLDVAALEAQIHRLGGHEPGPLNLEPVAAPDVGRERPLGEPLSTDRTAIWRILDAAANRAGEGLRVIEDYARFALDDRFLTAQCKTLRHELTAALQVFPLSLRHAARETRGDVGAGLSLASEQVRGRRQASRRGRIPARAAGPAQPGRICKNPGARGRTDAGSAALPNVHAPAGDRHRHR